MNSGVVFRVDSGSVIGSGHLMRCMALADYLAVIGFDIHFVCCDYVRHLSHLVENKGFRLHMISSSNEPELNRPTTWVESQQSDLLFVKGIIQKLNNIEWLIVDHYGLDEEWESAFLNEVSYLMVIDDLANRKHCCHILLDQTYKRHKNSYTNLVPNDCDILVGSQYALLRDEFSIHRKSSLARHENCQMRTLLISLGGSDPSGITLRVLDCLKKMNIIGLEKIIIVVTSSFPSICDIKKSIHDFPYDIQLKVDISNMAEIMTNSDWMIGAAGTTALERCCLGLPSIAIAVADNQKDSANKLATDGALILIEDTNLLEEALPKLIKELCYIPENLKNISLMASHVTEGYGCEMVSRKIFECSQGVSV